ncbi:MAG: oligosaccharide flippase family protein [Bacteroidota bacterium]
MHKKFLKNISLILFLNILIKPLWVLGIDRVVQNKIGLSDYGFYYAIFNFTFLLNILLDFGITNFNNKNIAQNNHLLRKHLSSIVMLKFILAVIYLFVCLLVGFIIGYDSRHFIFLLALCFMQFLISLTMYLRSNLSGLHLFKLDSFMSILDRLIMIVLCSVLLWGGLNIKFSVETYIVVQLIGYFATTMIVLIVVFKKAKSRFLKLNWNLPFSVMIIKHSFPFAILILLMAFYNRIDTVLLERMLPDGEGAVQSGIYASAYRLLDATNMLAFLFAGMLLPIFSRMLKLKENVEQLVKMSYTLIIVPSIIISLASFFYSEEIMKLLYGDGHYMESAAVFRFIMFCFIPISTTYIFGTLLTANSNLKALNIMAACGMCVNLILNFILIPHYKAVGAAFASMSTQLITALVQVYIAKVKFDFKVNWRFLRTLAIFIFGVIGISLLSKYFIHSWMVSIVVMGVVSLVWAVVSKIIDIKGFVEVLKNG